MKYDIYKTEYPPSVADVLDELRNRIAKIAGVTLTGNRLTVRFDTVINGKKVFSDAHFVLLEVETGEEEE